MPRRIHSVPQTKNSCTRWLQSRCKSCFDGCAAPFHPLKYPLPTSPHCLSLNLLSSKDFKVWRTQPRSKPAKASFGSLRLQRASSVCGNVQNFTTTVPKNRSRSLATVSWIQPTTPLVLAAGERSKIPCMSVRPPNRSYQALLPLQRRSP